MRVGEPAGRDAEHPVGPHGVGHLGGRRAPSRGPVGRDDVGRVGVQAGDRGEQTVLVGRGDPEHVEDHAVERHLVGVAAHEQVDLPRGAGGDRVDGLAVQQLAVEHRPSGARPIERVAQAVDGEVRRVRGEAPDRRDEALVRDVDEVRRRDAEVGGERGGGDRGLLPGEDVRSPAALDDRAPHESRRRGREEVGEAQGARGLAEHRDPVGVAAERRGVGVHPGQRGDLVVEPAVREHAGEVGEARGPRAGSSR